ncbi:MAG TPA: hypothetical protein VGQ90_02015 [Stellaceae bacterium]|nr:hypothetical protein [Stellaceae bacterium]
MRRWPRRRLTLPIALVAAAIAGVAWGGHEVPVYPSYYPHEITIETMPPERAGALLRDAKIQAYVGAEPSFGGDRPAAIRTVASLGDFVVVRANKASAAMTEEGAACAAAASVARDMDGKPGFILHPYPVTPFHGDYLYHADRAEAALTRLRQTGPAPPAPRVRVAGALAGLVRPEWRTDGPDWDVSVEAVDAAGLVAATRVSIDGWLGPPWLKSGWFHAVRLLADAIDDPAARLRIDGLVEQIELGAYWDLVHRINLERDVVAALTAGCRALVAGYTLRQHAFSAEFTNGIENIGFDSIEGFNSPMFIRTVKLKDFPWNGWLALGVDGSPAAAWNPIAGFDDGFGRLLWSAVGDPALLPQPYDAGWMLNRISDVQENAGSR